MKMIEKIIDTALNGENMILRAPSGFGKTITVLTATIPILEKIEDKKMLWLCRTHRENNRVIEEIKKIKNLPNAINAITIEARVKLCIKDMDKSLKKDHEAFSILCSEMKKQGKCEYYDKRSIEKMEIPQICGTKEIIELCRREAVCPYEVVKEKAATRRIIIANYNYILIPQMFKTLNLKLKDTILVVDEAHNLPEIAINMEVEKLTIKGLEETILEMEREGLTHEINVIEKLMKIIVKENVEAALEKDYIRNIIEGEGYNLEDLTLKLITEGNRVRRKLAREGKNPISHIHHVGKFLRKLQNVMEKEEYAIFSGNNELWIECFDATNTLRKIYNIFNATISMSGTIDEKYGELIGLEKYNYEEVTYANSRRNTLSIIVENVSTEYEERSPKMYRKINEYIFMIAENFKRGIGIFTASYEVLEGLIEAGIRNLMKPMYIEDPNEDSKTIEWKIEAYKEKAREEGAIYMGVCGGRASEGEDFPGREMDIVLLVGIPFPEPSIRIKKRNEYYMKKFGDKGKLYGYILPAIWKASQAAGRVIRGPEDKGVIVYMDGRYKKYCDLLPEWLKPSKIVNEPEQLKEEITLFFTP